MAKNWTDYFSEAFINSYGQAQQNSIKQKEIKADQAYRQWQMEQQQKENEMAMLKMSYAPSVRPTSQVPPGMYIEMGGQGYRYRPEIAQQQMMAQMTPLQLAQTGYYQTLSKWLNNPEDMSVGLQGQAEDVQEQTYLPEDYQITEETRNIRGIPKTVKIRKLKPAVSEKHGDVITSNSNLLSQLELARNYVEKGGFTGIVNKLPFADTVRKQFGSEATINLAQVLKQMQSGYITSQTGAQRGFKEMRWYEPAMPTMDMPTEKIKPMLDNSARLQELNLRNMLHTSKKRGERLGEFKDLYEQLIDKYPLDIIPYGVSQVKAELRAKKIDQIKEALAEGYSQKDIEEFLSK